MDLYNSYNLILVHGTNRVVFILTLIVRKILQCKLSRIMYYIKKPAALDKVIFYAKCI